MIKVKTALAATIALAACANTGLLAADTNAPAALNSPKIGAPGSRPTFAHSWYGTGSDAGNGYYDPALYQYNPYPYYNIVGGETYDPSYVSGLPNQNESPFNPPAALSRHGVMMRRPSVNPSSLSFSQRPAPAVPPSAIQDVH